MRDLACNLICVILSVLVASATTDESRPVDTTGKTSIIVEFPNGEWCELRGPGRFLMLEELDD